jgi:hypothetical protein
MGGPGTAGQNRTMVSVRMNSTSFCTAVVTAEGGARGGAGARLAAASSRTSMVGLPGPGRCAKAARSASAIKSMRASSTWDNEEHSVRADSMRPDKRHLSGLPRIGSLRSTQPWSETMLRFLSERGGSASLWHYILSSNSSGRTAGWRLVVLSCVGRPLCSP